jgi:hypothetical protein
MTRQKEIGLNRKYDIIARRSYKKVHNHSNKKTETRIAKKD